MDTTRPKYPLGLKLTVSIVGLAVILFVSFAAWLGYLDTRDFIDSRSPTTLTANSSLIILARIDTNAPISFIVTEIWKQPAETSAQPIKIGARFPVGWPKDGGPLPDGEVIFYHRDSPIPLIEPKPKLIPWSKYVIWQERIDNMTVQQFKTSYGL
jgi:hypothetical protein